MPCKDWLCFKLSGWIGWCAGVLIFVFCACFLTDFWQSWRSSFSFLLRLFRLEMENRMKIPSSFFNNGLSNCSLYLKPLTQNLWVDSDKNRSVTTKNHWALLSSECRIRSSKTELCTQGCSNARQNNTEHDRKIQVIWFMKRHIGNGNLLKTCSLLNCCRVRTVRRVLRRGARCPTYDTQPSRDYEYVPLWASQSIFVIHRGAWRCKQHGIHVERVPWAEGKERMTKSYRVFWHDGRSVCRGKKRRRYLGRAGKAYTAPLKG